MQEASQNHPGKMFVVIGLEEKDLLDEAYWVANLNCPGQIVVGCSLEKERLVIRKLQKKGAKRIMPLSVSGAFHTPLMKEAKDQLEPFIRKTTLKESSILFVMNVVGDFVNESDTIKQCLIDQICLPTKWEKGVKTILEKAPDFFYEIGPSQLQSIHKKIGQNVPFIGIEKVKDLEKIVV